MGKSADRQVTILAPGSRGDVAPCIALAAGLRAQGYAVRVVAHPSLSRLFDGRDVELRELSSYSREAVEEAVASLYTALARPLPSPSGVREAWRRFAENYDEQMVAECLEACAGSCAVLFTIIDVAGLSVAERLGIPAFPLYSSPCTRSHHMAHPFLLPFADSVAPLNYLSHLVGEQLSWQTFRPIINRARHKLGLPPMPLKGPFAQLIRQQQPIFYHYSEALLPKPRDWGPHAHVTGYWFLDPVTRRPLPASLQRFLDDGPKPIFVGFGSMSSLNSQARLGQVLQAARAAGVRVVVETSWAGIDAMELPEDVFVVQGDVPHVALLPHVAAAIHHGGVGTAHAALRAGVPSVVCPLLGDQFLWGSRVARVGAAPPIVGPRRFTVSNIAAAIQQAISDPGIATSAAEIGRVVRAEDGVARAATALRGYLEHGRRRPNGFGVRSPRPRRAEPTAV